MSLLLKKAIGSKGQIGVWKIEESDQFFKSQLPIAASDEQHLSKLHHRRKVEWLAGRYLVYHLHPKAGRCGVDSYGKPFLLNSPHHISISHSGGLASVIVNSQSVGIDIQKITTKIKRIAHKFMREEEFECLEESTGLEHLHVFWGAKEALYKAYGKRQLDFRKHIFVRPFTYEPLGGSAVGIVSKGDFYAEYDLRYETIQNNVMVYCVQR